MQPRGKDNRHVELFPNRGSMLDAGSFDTSSWRSRAAMGYGLAPKNHGNRRLSQAGHV